FGFGDCAAVDGAQEIVQESLPGGGVIEHVADERGFGGLLDEVAEALRGGVEAFEEEGEDGGVARRELRGVQVPTLIEAAAQGVLDVLVVQSPCALDGALVLCRLCRRKRLVWRSAMRCDGH